MTPGSLSRKIKRLRVRAPITASYERALMARCIWSNEGVWYIANFGRHNYACRNVSREQGRHDEQRVYPEESQ